jgi:hypothetical protein
MTNSGKDPVICLAALKLAKQIAPMSPLVKPIAGMIHK